jgi:hypothetical protein
MEALSDLTRELPHMRHKSRVEGRPQLCTHLSHGELFCLSELTAYFIVQGLANLRELFHTE